MSSQSTPTSEEADFGYGQLLSILVRRIAWVSGAIATSVGLAILMTLREDPTYRSDMQLLVEPNYRQRVDITGTQDERASLSQTDYATQLSLMRSNIFAEQAVEKLQEEFPNICQGFETLSACARPFQRNLNLSQLSEDGTATRIFVATATGTDPVVIRVFLENLKDVYLNYNVEQQEQRLEDGLALVNRQIEEVREALTASRQELKQFRERQNLIDPSQQALSVANTLTQVEQRQIDVDTQYRDVLARYSGLQDQLAADPDTALVQSRLSQSSRYQQLLNTLQTIELQLEQRRALYAEADPGLQDLISQRTGQLALLQEEVRRVLGTIPAQISFDETELLTEGQLSGIDLNLVSELVQAEVALDSLQARQSGLEQAQRELGQALNAFPSLIAEYDRIQPEIGIQQQALEQLLQLRQELSNELAQGGFSWAIVKVPELGQQIAPVPQRNLLLGAIAGLFIGGALAFGREAIDKVVHTSDDLKRQAILPLLGVIPEMTTGALNIVQMPLDSEQVSAETFSLVHWQPFRDAVDWIYQTIQLSSEQPLPSLMVSSALPGEGKTMLAIGLALSAARLHRRVLLIDANLRRPSLHEQLGLSNEEGLSTQLQLHPTILEQNGLHTLSLSLGGTEIDVLTAGPIPEDPVRLLSSSQMQRMLALAEESYDLVILDAPAILGLADGLQLASLCEGGVMVSRLDRITQADLSQAMAILSRVNTVGIIANGYRGDGSSGGVYTDDESARTATGTPKVLHALRSMLDRANPWKRTIALSTILGMASLLVSQEQSSSQESSNSEHSGQPNHQPSQQSPNYPLTRKEQSGELVVTSIEAGVTSIHIPQWSNST
ncbi:MAG: GumC family protein [Leptolyngbyaceae cyanobacterium]